MVARASDEDAELEKRLENLRKVKGATPYGQGKSRKDAPDPLNPKAVEAKAAAKAAAPKVEYDYTNEKVHFEGGTALGDLVLNLALGTTLVWLPLTAAAVGRAAFVKVRFTDKRLSIISTAPWKQDQTDIAYQEVRDVVTVGRALGLWGDMVVTLNNGDKLEMRSLENYKELKAYVLARRDELVGPGGPPPPTGGKPKLPKGAMVTAEELMGEPASSGKGKGFA